MKIIQAEQNATSFLQKYNLRLEDLPSLVPPGKHISIMLAGSIAEGLANQKSDLDLIVISNEKISLGLEITEDECAIYNCIHKNGIEINIEQYNFSTIERLAHSMRIAKSVFENPQASSSIPIITSVSDMRIMHRLRTSVCIYGKDSYHEIQGTLLSDFFPLYMMFIHLKKHLALKEDAAAEWGALNSVAASWLVRTSTKALSQAYLSLHGYTHHNDRWMATLLIKTQTATSQALLKFLCEEKVENPEQFLEWSRFCDEVYQNLIAVDEGLGLLMEKISNCLPLSVHLGT